MRYLVFLAILVCVGCTPGKWSVTEENDYFTFFNKDHSYTQGLIVSKTTGDRTAAIGQRIYTPSRKREPNPIRDDRPYAGYLYGKMGVGNVVDATKQSFDVEFGLIGPHAYGEEVQCGFHKLVGQDCPAGWHNQLKDEPTITLRAAIENEAPREFLFTDGILLTRVMIEVGNLSDQIQLDSILRFDIAKWVSFYAGPRIHLVAHNIFLDGNTFRDSQSVSTKWYYTEMTTALEFKIKNTRITWQIVVESPQYEEQASSYNWGGVTVSWEL